MNKNGYEAMRHATFYLISKDRQQRELHRRRMRWLWVTLSLVSLSIILTIATSPWWRPV